jgi:hypothetical protein
MENRSALDRVTTRAELGFFALRTAGQLPRASPCRQCWNRPPVQRPPAKSVGPGPRIPVPSGHLRFAA